MRRPIARLKGLGFILWHARHELYHVLLGLVWAWILRERWDEFNGRWILFAVIGSVIPDMDHFIYFLTHGRKDYYTVQIRNFIRNHEWRVLIKFIENGHKYNTNLITHNYYFMSLLLALAVVAFFIDWKSGVVIIGAMLIHYFYDVFDDIITLGYINSNWKRWGKPKKSFS